MNQNEYRKVHTLILTQTDPKNDMVFDSWKSRGYSADIIFKDVPKFFRVMRRVFFVLKIDKLCGMWLGNWKHELTYYNTIILHANAFSAFIPSWIHRRYPEIRIIYWYWNKIDKYTMPKLVKDKEVEFWTFNDKDVEEYALKKNTQYYSTIGLKSEDDIVKWDIYFIGHDHGRKHKIDTFKNNAEKLGLRCNFRVIKNKGNYIPYSQVQKEVLQSNAVLEFNQEGQNGYTLRTMEALFLNKKLITNNSNIRDAPFYRKENVFLIDFDLIENLKSFLKIPYNQSVDVYKKQYDLDMWFNNFYEVEKNKC